MLTRFDRVIPNIERYRTIPSEDNPEVATKLNPFIYHWLSLNESYWATHCLHISQPCSIWSTIQWDGWHSKPYWEGSCPGRTTKRLAVSTSWKCHRWGSGSHPQFHLQGTGEAQPKTEEHRSIHKQRNKSSKVRMFMYEEVRKLDHGDNLMLVRKKNWLSSQYPTQTEATAV